MDRAKNIVICCDGTNNQIESSPTNVFLLFQALKNIPGRQETLYLPGVGTMAAPGLDSPIRRRLSILGGLAFGAGLQSDYEEAYRFLMNTYAPGDRIFIFGFSRGSLTARAIAGMVHMFGLLRPGQEGLVPYLSRHYANANFSVIGQIKRFTRRRIKIEFLGLWDTVASYGFAYKRRTLPFTANNRDVKVVRHAMAVDERRGYFRAFRWGRKYSKAATTKRKRKPVDQDVLEVWFPGVHSDVGGGYDSGHLSRITLEWMLAELKATNLRLRIHARYMREAFGIKRGETFVPDPWSLAHESLKGAWWPVELLPKNGTVRRGQFEWPFGRRRHMLPDPENRIRVHASVFARCQAYGSDYQPLPLPNPAYDRVAWSGQQPSAPPNPLPELPKLKRWLAYSWSIPLLALLALFAASIVWNIAVWLWPYKDVLALFVLPLLTLSVGSWVMGVLSGFSRHTHKLREPMMYRVWGYTEKVINRNVSQLRKDRVTDGSKNDGLAALHRALCWDLGFPIIYGPVLFFTLQCLVTEPMSSQPWYWLTLLGLLPALTMLADWRENLLLLKMIGRTSHNTDPVTVAKASFATKAKLACYTACAVLPPLGWLILQAWNSFRTG